MEKSSILLGSFLKGRIEVIETGIIILIDKMSMLPRTLSWKKWKNTKMQFLLKSAACNYALRGDALYTYKYTFGQMYGCQKSTYSWFNIISSHGNGNVPYIHGYTINYEVIKIKFVKLLMKCYRYTLYYLFISKRELDIHN